MTPEQKAKFRSIEFYNELKFNNLIKKYAVHITKHRSNGVVEIMIGGKEFVFNKQLGRIKGIKENKWNTKVITYLKEELDGEIPLRETGGGLTEKQFEDSLDDGWNKKPKKGGFTI